MYPKISRIGQKASEPNEVPRFQKETRWWWISLSWNIPTSFNTLESTTGEEGQEQSCQLMAQATQIIPSPLPVTA